jgi:hypothetical protein
MESSAGWRIPALLPENFSGEKGNQVSIEILKTQESGYVVIAAMPYSITRNDEYIVTAHRPDAVQPFVTWLAAPHSPVSADDHKALDFWFGHYFAPGKVGRDAALSDMFARAMGVNLVAVLALKEEK